MFRRSPGCAAHLLRRSSFWLIKLPIGTRKTAKNPHHLAGVKICNATRLSRGRQPARFVNEATTTIFTIPLDCPGILAIAPRPRGNDWLDDDVRASAARGFDVFVSLLEPQEAHELGLEHEAAVCDSNGLAFVSLPIPDRGTPSNFTEFARAVAELVTRLRSGKRIAVHCRQSVGRSGILAVSMAVAIGVDLQNAIEIVSVARGVRVPETPVQLEWLREHQEALSRLAG